jgi:CheY-like chemotaxis protein
VLEFHRDRMHAATHRTEPGVNASPMVCRKHILVVDDDDLVRETIKMLLEIDQHTVTEARSGKEAIGLFEPGRFDLVMTDYAMAYMRGDELAARLKEVAPDQPILMVTGSVQDEGAAAFKVDDLLRKPFLLDDLRQSVEHLLSPKANAAPGAAAEGSLNAPAASDRTITWFA